jgi:hypothetical protein
MSSAITAVKADNIRGNGGPWEAVFDTADTGR